MKEQKSQVQHRDPVSGTRYRIITAHVTAMRFRTPLRTAGKFADALEKYRREEFGDSVVDELQLIQNDWYASPDQTTTLSKFRLSGGNALPPSPM